MNALLLKSMNLDALSWMRARGGFLFHRWGLVRCIALFSILLSSLLYGYWQYQHTLQEVRLTQERIQLDQSIVDAKPVVSNLPKVDPLDEWLLTWQPKESLPIMLQSILKMAKEQGVPLKEGRYQLSKPKQLSGPIVVYSLTFSIQTTYPILRKWMQAVFQSHPFVSLESLTMSRQEATQPMIDVEMVWAIYLRDDMDHAE